MAKRQSWDSVNKEERGRDEVSGEEMRVGSRKLQVTTGLWLSLYVRRKVIRVLLDQWGNPSML